LVAVLTKQMGAYFPELKIQRQLITNVIKEEENSFLRTLDQGLVLLDGIIKNTQGTEVSGKKAFELFDTYGFPIDLTALILSEKKMTLDEEEFETELKKQKARSRAASVVETDDWVILYGDDDEEEFVGYDTLKAKVRITRYRKVSSKKDGDMYQLVFNLTPFYPEGGGQVGDKGYLEKEDGSTVYIVDTKKENNLIIHFAKSLPKNLTGTFNVVVDEKQRFRTACNHTATHLLHQALREVLGEHVEQKGSAVHSKHLRFDFSHFAKLTVDELTAVEDFVNARIENKLPLQEFRNIPMETAMDKGAMALFGEKYGDTVRAIQYGQSVELCGGTHVQNTGDIWHFRIQSESAIASGIRRIEAITGDAMKTEFSENNRTLFQIKELVKNSKNPADQVLGLIEDNAKLRKQIEQLLKEKAKNAAAGLANETELINGVNFLAKKLELDQNSIKDLANDLGNKIENLFLIIGSETDGKAFLTCYISKNLVAEKQLNAGLVVRELGKLIQGGGGGQPFFASAGGKNPAGIEEALKQAKDYIK
jgi:alanyl-tRNA synthetase